MIPSFLYLLFLIDMVKKESSNSLIEIRAFQANGVPFTPTDIVILV